MKRIIVFSSREDRGKRFKNAIGRAWNVFGFGDDFTKQWIRFYDASMMTAQMGAFDLLLACEPDNIPDDYTSYQNILKDIADVVRSFIGPDDQLYVLFHNNTDNDCKDIQRAVVQRLCESYIPCYYSHSPNNSQYKAIANVMETGKNAIIEQEEYQKRFGKLLATLSFPALYDQAASIQMRLFLQYCQSQSETHGDNPVDLCDLQQSYQEFAAAARSQSPDLDEIKVNDQNEVTIPQSLQVLCSNDLDQKAVRENINEFGRHLNSILISVPGA